MNEFSNKVVEVCNSRYQTIYCNYSNKSGEKIVSSHFGEFSQELVNSTSNGIEEMMIEAGDKKSTIKRMFSILVEALQNIRLHGEKNSDGKQISFLIIAKEKDDYLITIGNLVSNTNKIANRIDQLNALNQKEIKDLYMKVLTNGTVSNKGGAGLGFITMAMKSKNNLSYKLEEINKALSFFTLEIKVNKN